MKKSNHEFITFLEHNKEQVSQIICSAPLNKNGPFKKTSVRAIVLKQKKKFQVNSFTCTQCFTKNYSFDESSLLFSSLISEYSHIIVHTNKETIYASQHDTGIFSFKRKRTQNSESLSLEHNRKKEHLIPEGIPVDFLIALAIMDSHGNVFREKHDKFKQINQFVQHVFEVVKFKKSEKYTIIDFGCGKAVLTFALAFFLKDYNVQLIGIDLKKELLEKCQVLAHDLGYKNLTFCSTSIDEWRQKEPVDVVIALHACNTASDDAIIKACDLGAKTILIAPCCHHEVQRHIEKKQLPLLLQYPLLKERFSSLLTDALRAEFLSQMGYKVDIVEFVDPEHTPKNILVRACKKAHHTPPNWIEYKACLENFGLTSRFQLGASALMNTRCDEQVTESKEKEKDIPL